MAFRASRPTPALALHVLIYLFLSTATAEPSISFCSSQNTNSGSSPTFDHYQSIGACQQTCQNSYAYAVLQGSNCWCSDYAPADQTDTGSCNSQCPGFPSDECGNQGQGLFGYYQLGKVQPSGTAGASPSASPSPSPSPSSSPQESPPSTSTITVQDTVTSNPNPSVSVSVILSTVQQTSSPQPSSAPSPTESSSPAATTQAPAPSSSSPPETTWSPTPSAVVTTVLGSIQTVIITPTAPPNPAQTQVTTISATTPDNFWSDTAKVAGTFTAVAVVVVALLGLLIWFLLRRLRSHESIAIRSTSDGDNTSAMGVPFGAEKRNSKLTLTTAGLGGMRRGDSNEKSTAENTPASMSRRASIPLVHDQRLDPRALFNIENGNASHISVGSFRDDRDYSRPVLHVRNPD